MFLNLYYIYIIHCVLLSVNSKMNFVRLIAEEVNKQCYSGLLTIHLYDAPECTSLKCKKEEVY